MTGAEDANAREHAADSGVTAGRRRSDVYLFWGTPHGQQYVSLLVRSAGRSRLRRGRDDAR